MLRPFVHIALHLAAPALIARFGFRKNRLRSFLIMLSAMVIDLDHLLADPIFDPDRCSVGFHPLHSWWAIAVYCVLLFVPKVRIFALGLVVHIALDVLDCLWMGSGPL